MTLSLQAEICISTNRYAISQGSYCKATADFACFTQRKWIFSERAQQMHQGYFNRNHLARKALHCLVQLVIVTASTNQSSPPSIKELRAQVRRLSWQWPGLVASCALLGSHGKKENVLCLDSLTEVETLSFLVLHQ